MQIVSASVKYQHRKSKEYNHLQMARYVHSEDDAKVRTTTQSINKTHITVACQQILYRIILSKCFTHHNFTTLPSHFIIIRPVHKSEILTLQSNFSTYWTKVCAAEKTFH